MNNDKLKEFINGIGVMCEVWILTYNQFITQGLAHKDALAHTQGLITAMINGMTGKDGGNE